MILGLAACSGPALEQPDLTVAAAASLREVIPAALEGYAAAAGERSIEVTYGASGDLRRQVAGGAPIDLVVLANAETVDALIDNGLADPASRRVVASNRLALVGPSTGPPLTFATLNRLPGDARLAVGDPRTVPAGQYARQALENLGSWNHLQDRLVFGGHVASVLAYVRRGEVDAAIVYETDAEGLADVAVWEVAKGDWAPDPQVVAAVINSDSADAHRLLDYLTSPEGQEIFLSFGFDPPTNP
ncbi:MAG: molybdate ABC transporter substrate-binding protein [Thermoanaerobaculia bacterium]